MKNVNLLRLSASLTALALAAALLAGCGTQRGLDVGDQTVQISLEAQTTSAPGESLADRAAPMAPLFRALVGTMVLYSCGYRVSDDDFVIRVTSAALVLSGEAKDDGGVSVSGDLAREYASALFPSRKDSLPDTFTGDTVSLPSPQSDALCGAEITDVVQSGDTYVAYVSALASDGSASEVYILSLTGSDSPVLPFSVTACAVMAE